MRERADVAGIVASCQRQIVVEGLRRWLLIAAFFLAALLATWTDFHPYFAVGRIGKWDQDVQPIVLQTSESQSWFNKTYKALSEGAVSGDWLYRLTSDDIKEVVRYQKGKTSFQPDVRRIVFAQSEEPLASIFQGKPQGETIFLARDSADKKAVLKVYLADAPRLSGLGSGIYGVPEAFSYPLRKYWYWPLAVGFLGYLLLPWAKTEKNVCAYKLWQVRLGDFASTLLYGSFVALPFFIVGGAVEAVTNWLPFTAFFWFMAALGLLAFWWSFFYAVYRIHILDDKLVFAAPGSVKAIALSDITKIEQVSVVPPKWFITVYFLAALSGTGRGAFNAGTLGRAALLSSCSSGGLCLVTRDGNSIYIWLTNSTGQNSVTNLDLLLDKLKEVPREQAEQADQIREFEALFPPIIEPYSKARTARLIKV